MASEVPSGLTILRAHKLSALLLPPESCYQNTPGSSARALGGVPAESAAISGLAAPSSLAHSKSVLLGPCQED